MKKYITYLQVAIICLLSGTSFSQSADKWQTVTIQTSAECGDCETRIESALNFTKGVKFAELDMETKRVTVKFNQEKISLEELKKALNAIGYSADDFKASREQINQLPACCQPGGMQNSERD